MIILQDIQSRLADSKELIEKKANHPYLIQNIGAPVIDEDKLLLLIMIFNQLSISDIEKNTYTTSSMLIQIALDTHDFVHATLEETDIKNQQLMVLAGDYFSGLYYQHLSEINNIALIRELSKGIKEINEHKIMVYEQTQSNDIAQLLTHLRKIEGALIAKLTNFFHLEYWNDFVMNFLLVKRLLEEKSVFKMSGSSIGFEAMKKIIFPKCNQVVSDLSNEQQKYLLLVCDRSINHAIHLMNDGMEKLPPVNELLRDRIHIILNQHQTMVKTLVEEG